MKNMRLFEYIGTVLAGSWFVDHIGNYGQAYLLFAFLMVLDYASGMLASYKEAINNPKNKRYGWSSKKGLIGIFKKLGYVLVNIVALCMDYLLHRFLVELGIDGGSSANIAIIVLVWFILNELLSITENAARMGAPLPSFLTTVLSDWRDGLKPKQQ